MTLLVRCEAAEADADRLAILMRRFVANESPRAWLEAAGVEALRLHDEALALRDPS